MMTTELYFRSYLAYEMNSLSSGNPNPQFAYNESFAALDSRLLAWHAEQDRHPGAMEELGERYLFGVDSVEQDVDKARQLLSDASQLGHPDATFALAQLYRKPEFGKLDMDRHFRLLSLAAEQGSHRAMFNLACAYYKGRDSYGGHGFDMDKAHALELSIAAADRARELIEMFLTRPCSRSFQPIMQAAYQVFVSGTCTAAQQYLEGDGVPANDGAAERLLSKAQEFHVSRLGSPCGDFTRMMA